MDSAPMTGRAQRRVSVTTAGHAVTAGRAAIAICLLTVLNGCAVGGKSFSIDSNSRVPFFGLDLVPKSGKSDPSSYRSIAQTTPAKPRSFWPMPTKSAEPAVQTLQLPRTDLNRDGEPLPDREVRFDF